MKTKIISIIISCLILFNCIPAYASTNVMVGDDTVEEVSVLANDILSDVNRMFELEDNTIKAEDIDYSKAVKFYEATGFFRKEITNKDGIIEYVENSEYMYRLPVIYGNKTVIANYGKWDELTDEEREEFPEDSVEYIEKNIGKWHVSSIGVTDKVIDYKANTEKVLKDNNIENAQVYFLIGASENLGLLAVICREDTQELLFNVLDNCGLNEEDVADYSPYLDNEVLYSYEELKAIADKDYEELQKQPAGTYGGAGGLATADSSKIIIISAVSAVAVVIIAVTSVIIIKKRRKNNSAEQI